MSWTMWHVYGTGFDVSKADPGRFKQFLLNHAEKMSETMHDESNYSKTIEALRCNKFGREEMEDLSYLTDRGTVAELIGMIMTAETNIGFCVPGTTDDGEEYVLFTAMYPWQMNETEKGLDTFEKLFGIMKRYGDELGLKTEEDVDLTYSG